MPSSMNPIGGTLDLSEHSDAAALGLGPSTIAEPVLKLDSGQIAQLRFLAEITYPFEACGVLIGESSERAVSVCQVLQTTNLSDYGTRDRYVMDPEDFLVADRMARLHGREIVGIWHSHPNHPVEPSKIDLAGAWAGYSYVIVAVDALGDTVVGSWRLRGDGLVRQRLQIGAAVSEGC